MLTQGWYTDLLHIAFSVEEERTEYEDRIERLEQENERLQRRVEKVIAMNEEHGELVKYVSREKSLQIQREERQNAPVWKRGYWWVFGRGEQDTLASEE